MCSGIMHMIKLRFQLLQYNYFSNSEAFVFSLAVCLWSPVMVVLDPTPQQSNRDCPTVPCHCFVSSLTLLASIRD